MEQGGKLLLAVSELLEMDSSSVCYNRNTQQTAWNAQQHADKRNVESRQTDIRYWSVNRERK